MSIIRRWRALRWSTIAGGILLVSLGLSATRLWATEETRALLRTIFFVAVGTLASGRYVLGFRGGHRRYARAKQSGQPIAQCLLATQPAEVFGLQRMGGALLIGFLRQVVRRDASGPPAGERFGYLKTSSYPAAAMVVALALLVELPVGYLLMKGVGIPEPRLHLLHGALLSLTAWILVLGIGDRYWLRRGVHVLDEDHLHLCLGARVQGRLALARVTGCMLRPSNRMASGVIAPANVLEVSPMDTPNVRLLLAPLSLSDVMAFGAPIPPGVCVLDLRVDDPGRLVRLIGAQAERARKATSGLDPSSA